MCDFLVSFVFVECKCVFKNNLFLHICNFSASSQVQATQLLWTYLLEETRVALCLLRVGLM